jgi:hypothetical protein
MATTDYTQSAGMTSATATDNVTEATPSESTAYTQSAGMDGDTTTDNVTELAGQAVAAGVAAAADVVLTNADVVLTGADADATAADRIAVAADLVLTDADTTATSADRVAVAADLVQTNLDQIATAADRVATTQDALDTAADVVLTNADVVTTNADAATTTQDALDTAADVVLTSADVVSTAADLAATAQDVIDSAANAAAAIVAKMEWQGAWTTSTAYALNDVIEEAGSSYICIVAHTSGTFATDLTAVKWELVAQAGADGTGTGDLVSTNNLSDLANAATARTNLGVAIGSDVQAYALVLANTTASYTTAEETKLAGVEALADVTDSTNVTAAGAVMDSELASVADVKALDQSVVSGATPTFGIANMTLADTSLVVVDTTNMQTFADGVDSALLRARGTGFTSTYVSTAAVGGTTFAQPAVNGEIYSDQGYYAISYAGATGITVATLTAPSTYVYIDNAGNLQQQTSTPTRQDWSRKMFTMRIAVDTVAETILGFEYLANPIGHYANSDRDIFTALLAQGVPFKGGQVITGRATDFGFDAGAGTIMEYGGTGDIHNPNLISLNAVSNATYDLLSRTAVVTEDETNLVKFWDNAGTITALGSGTFVAHRLYRFSNGQFAIQYGQGNYANIVLARAGLLLEDYVLNERLINATFFGWWILGETATNTGGTTLTEFREYTIGVQGGSSSVLAGCLLKGNNLSDLLDVSAAQVNLDLEPGVDVQAYAAVLANTTASFLTADESKLDAIEALADVTDANNVTAAGALMDSEVTNLAAVKAFDGADYATAAQGTLADNAAPLASPTFTGVPAGPTAAATTNTTQLATTAQVRLAIPDVLNAGGSAPVYACRAWVNFNGTGTVAIRASGNVSSITDNGTGDYTVNFTTALPTADYVATFGMNSWAASDPSDSDVYVKNAGANNAAGSPTLKTTSALRIIVGSANGNIQNVHTVMVSIFC